MIKFLNQFFTLTHSYNSRPRKFQLDSLNNLPIRIAIGIPAAELMAKSYQVRTATTIRTVLRLKVIDRLDSLRECGIVNEYSTQLYTFRYKRTFQTRGAINHSFMSLGYPNRFAL